MREAWKIASAFATSAVAAAVAWWMFQRETAESAGNTAWMLGAVAAGAVYLLARRLLGEDLKMPHIATWWCGQTAAREEVLDRLDEFVIEGIKTTIPLHKRILDDPDFQKGHVSTTFLEQFLAS